MQLESHLFLIRFDFSGCFSAWNPGLNLVMHRKEGCWVSFLWHSLCPISPASRTSGIYGHLGPKLQAPTFSKGPQPSEQRLSSKVDPVHFAIPQKIPVSRGRKSKRKYGFLIQCWERSPGQGNFKLWFLLPSEVISSQLLKMCPSREQWTEISLFLHDCIHSHVPLLFFCAITVTGSISRACTIHTQVQDRQKTD